MHPTGGSLRVFRRFSWLEAGSAKVALPRSAHQPVTLAVGQFNIIMKFMSITGGKDPNALVNINEEAG